MAIKQKTMDGNEAAAYASYAFTEFAAIYPITPSSPMAELTDKWAAQGKKNIFGHPVKLVEMQSEAGAVSAVHGALDCGCLSTSYTASQGLMLMIPTMYRIAGQLKPCVIHVASRNVATNNISIFAEHSDVMACRQTGFAMLCSSDVQQAMDMAAVAHLSTISAHVPFLHFFDGFRTSHEIQKVDCLDYEELAKCVDWDALEAFRRQAQNPEHPRTRTSGLNSDTYFQAREAMNTYYDQLPQIVEENMKKINALTGRNYHLFNYYGHPQAERVLVALGSIAGTAQMTVDHLMSLGEKVGYVEVHLFRPFAPEAFLASLPETVKSITVLDRNKEPGAAGEPLYEEVATVLKEYRPDLQVLACRFGLACKDTPPHMVAAIYANMSSPAPRNHFTVGIEDDVTHLSLPCGNSLDIIPADTISCKFWGLGSDGTVSANKNSIKIIGDHTQQYVQAYFEYDGKKSGGVTKSHLRFGHSPIRATYLVENADFVACHNQAYLKKYDMVKDLKQGGSMLLACPWDSVEALDANLPNAMKRALAAKNIHLYVIDSLKIADQLGLGTRTNTILQAAFFKITGIIPQEQAVEYMKQAITKSYGKKGQKVIDMNNAAVDFGMTHVQEIPVPLHWVSLPDDPSSQETEKPHFIREILEPVDNMQGDTVPVSAFLPYVDGSYPQQTAKWEKRGTAFTVPQWEADKCVQCNLCSYVCPHAAIRPFLMTEQEVNDAPSAIRTIPSKPNAQGLHFFMGVSVLDCQGCGSCANVCPAKAIHMEPLDSQKEQAALWTYADGLPEVRNPYGIQNVKGSQFQEPLLQFSGACAGCGETPYAKLVTQLFGERMYVATATGCSQVWATSFPSFPYSVNKKGYGPAVSGSLFENNAEFGLGIHLGAKQQREILRTKAAQLSAVTADETLRQALDEWNATFSSTEENCIATDKVKAALDKTTDTSELCAYVQARRDQLVPKSVWMFGGDGWAYDIGYGGLDHVLASGENVNILVFDTEVYSNTGGQASKATPTGAVAQFAANGKATRKKDLGMMAMSYSNVYVAQVAMGADPAQLLRALREAESFDGPSLVICYSPCINHGLRCGMADVMGEMKRAVQAGYWHLYRYDPQLIAQGKNPFQLDSKEPTGDYQAFLRGEVRYASLERTFPERVDQLFRQSEQDAKDRYKRYCNMAKQ